MWRRWWWLAKWADARRHWLISTQVATEWLTCSGWRRSRPRTRGLAARWRWARVYLSLGAASVVFCFLRTQWGFQGGVRAARKLYEGVSARTLNAPMSYFDTTPQGRVVSRFTFDTEQIDVLLDATSRDVHDLGGLDHHRRVRDDGADAGHDHRGSRAGVRRLLSDLAVLPVVGRRSTEIGRPVAESAASSVSEGVDVAATLRAFGVGKAFADRFERAVDGNTSALLAWTAAQRWVSLRYDLCAAVIAVAGGIAASYREEIGICRRWSVY